MEKILVVCRERYEIGDGECPNRLDIGRIEPVKENEIPI